MRLPNRPANPADTIIVQPIIYIVETIQNIVSMCEAAETDPERERLVQILRLAAPEQAEQVEEILVTNRVKAMPMSELIRLAAQHQGMDAARAEERIRMLIYEQLLDRDRVSILNLPLSSYDQPTAASPTDSPGAKASRSEQQNTVPVAQPAKEEQPVFPPPDIPPIRLDPNAPESDMDKFAEVAGTAELRPTFKGRLRPRNVGA